MRAEIIQTALKELGNSNPKKYWDEVWISGGPAPRHWCGAFTLWCLRQNGIAHDTYWQFNPPYYGYLFNLETTEYPLVGDIAYFDKPYQHHAIVRGYDGETLWTIDGNAVLSIKDPFPNRVLEKERLLINVDVTFYSIDQWLSEKS